MATTPKPLPPMHQDPSVTKGMVEQDGYPRDLTAISRDTALTPIARAEKIVALYTAMTGTLTALRADLYARRNLRLEFLQAQIPHGPGIPSDASPADRAVLSTAFRNSLESARKATREQRARMLTDALQFDDDALLRGVLTAADSDGQVDLFDTWARNAGKVEELAEVRMLSRQVSGLDGMAGLWEAKAFRQPPEPPEVRALPGLKAEAERARQAEQRSRHNLPAHLKPRRHIDDVVSEQLRDAGY
jgi:hypothetical protein